MDDEQRRFRQGRTGPFAIVGSVPGIVSFHVYWAIEQVMAVVTGDGPPDSTQR